MSIPLIFTFAHSRGKIDMFSDLTRTIMLTFWHTCLREVFQTLHDYNLAWDLVLVIHTRFNDLDLISKSQVCQNHKLQINHAQVFVHPSLLVQGCNTH